MENGLKSIKREGHLLGLFDETTIEIIADRIFEDIHDKQNSVLDSINKSSNKKEEYILSKSAKSLIKIELNIKLSSLKIWCVPTELSINGATKKFGLGQKYELLTLRRLPRIIFNLKDKPAREKRLINYADNCIYVPLLELMVRSGIISELNKKLKSINLECIKEESYYIRSCKYGIDYLKFTIKRPYKLKSFVSRTRQEKRSIPIVDETRESHEVLMQRIEEERRAIEGNFTRI